MQCHKMIGGRQCKRPAMDGSQHCRTHTRNKDLIASYRLSDPDLANSVQYHSKAALHDLSHQISLLRGVIERRLNLADDDPASKISAYNFVSGALGQLTKMTEALNKLNKESGNLMSRDEVMDTIDDFMEIVAEELRGVPDSDQIVDNIVSRISEGSENE